MVLSKKVKKQEKDTLQSLTFNKVKISHTLAGFTLSPHLYCRYRLKAAMEGSSSHWLKPTQAVGVRELWDNGAGKCPLILLSREMGEV